MSKVLIIGAVFAALTNVSASWNVRQYPDTVCRTQGALEAVWMEAETEKHLGVEAALIDAGKCIRLERGSRYIVHHTGALMELIEVRNVLGVWLKYRD